MLAQRAPRGLSRAVVLSLGVHLGAFVLAVAIAGYHPRRSLAPENVLITKLVRLGQERPPNFLPRKVVASPPAAAEPVPIAPRAAESKPSVAQEKLPTAKERVNQLASVQNALERLKQKAEVPEGRADGVRVGEAADLAHAVAGNQYVTEIIHCLHQNYDILGTNPDAVKNRSASVFIRIDGDGRFIESRIERSSGLTAFDRAVERAMQLCGKVSPPPEGMRERVRSDGIEVEFQP